MFSKFTHLSLIVAVLLLSSCSFFTKEKIPLEGKRVSVLEGQNYISPDIAVKGQVLNIPAPMKNSIWYQDGGNSEHKMFNLASGGEFKKKWSADFGTGSSKGEYMLASPVIANGVVFAIDAESMVTAHRLDDGKRIWKKKLKPEHKYQKSTSMKGAGIAVSPSSKKVFVTTGYGMVFALDMVTGKKQWSYDAELPIRIAPTIGGGYVFIQTVDNRLMALNASNGEEAWRFKTSHEATVLVGGANPAYSHDKDVLVAAFSNGEIRAFKVSTGSPLWGDYLTHRASINSLSSINAVVSAPIISGNVVYAAGSNNVLSAIDLRTGQRIWEKEIGTTSSMFLAGKYLFLTTNGFEVVAVDANNGKVLWSTGLSTGDDLSKKVGAYSTGPVMVDSKLIVATSNGWAFAISPHNGEILASTEVGKGVEIAPVAAEGVTIFATNNGKLVAFE